jgi:hypothetical protein
VAARSSQWDTPIQSRSATDNFLKRAISVVEIQKRTYAFVAELTSWEREKTAIYFAENANRRNRGSNAGPVGS